MWTLWGCISVSVVGDLIYLGPVSGLQTGKHDSAAESSGQSHSGQGQESALQSHLLHR